MVSLVGSDIKSEDVWRNRLETEFQKSGAFAVIPLIQEQDVSELLSIWTAISARPRWAEKNIEIVKLTAEDTMDRFLHGKLNFETTQSIADLFRKVIQHFPKEHLLTVTHDSEESVQLEGHRLLLASTSEQLYKAMQTPGAHVVDGTHWRREYYQKLVRLTESPHPFRGKRSTDLMMSAQAQKFLKDVGAEDFLHKQDIQRYRLSAEREANKRRSSDADFIGERCKELSLPSKVLLTSAHENHLKLNVIPFEMELAPETYSSIFPLVTHLHLSDWTLGRSGTVQLLQNADKLERVTVNLSGLETAGSRLETTLQGVKSLKIIGKKEADYRSLIALAECCPNITYLDFTDCKAITADAIVDIIRSTKKLETLVLTGTNIDDAGLTKIGEAQEYTHLKTLDISWCPYLTGKGLLAWKSVLPHVTFLNCHGFRRLRPEYLHPLIPSMTAMKKLWLRKCQRITDETLRLIGQNCTQLEELNVNRCQNVHELAVKKLAFFKQNIGKLYFNERNYGSSR